MSRAVGSHLWCGNPVSSISGEGETTGARFARWHDFLASKMLLRIGSKVFPWKLSWHHGLVGFSADGGILVSCGAVVASCSWRAPLG